MATLPPPRDSEILSEALAHRARGYAVLPVDQHKRPASRLIRKTRGRYSWQSLRERAADSDEIRAWFETNAQAGVGIITGQPSGIVVIDVDDESRAPDLPPSAGVVTRRGRHIYYRCDEPTRSRTFAWGELRADGAYVVAPTSRALGHLYRWEISPDEVGELTDFASAAPHLTPICPSCLRSNRDPKLGGLGRDFRAFDSEALQLANLERSAPLALRLAAALGAPEGLRLGETFPCLIHSDRRPSASLWRRDEDAHVLYRDWHAGLHRERQWLTLALVRARLAGRQGQLAAPELAVWKLRLASEAGLIEPLALDLDTDPPPQPLAAAWGGFLQLVALRWAAGFSEPAPFSVRFAAAWCGLSKREAHQAVSELARRGYLRLVGFDAYRNRLWLPQGVRPPA